MARCRYLSEKEAAAMLASKSLIHRFDIPGAYTVSMHHASRRAYEVLYGLEVEPCFDRAEAARALGYKLMHALACAGKG